MGKQRQHRKVVFSQMESYSVRLERLDEVITHRDCPLRSALYRAEHWTGQGHDDRPLLFVYDDEKDTFSPQFIDEMHEHCQALRRVIPACEGLDSSYSSAVVSIPASAFRDSDSPALGQMLASFRHFYDETGDVFSDGDFQSGTLSYLRFYDPDKGRNTTKWFFAGPPETEAEKKMFAALCFSGVESVISDAIWYQGRFYKGQIEDVLAALSIGMEDTSAYSDYLYLANWKMRPGIGVDDYEAICSKLTDPALVALADLDERMEVCLRAWRESLMGAAIPDFREDVSENMWRYEALAQAVGTKGWLEAYYSGIPADDLLA